VTADLTLTANWEAVVANEEVNPDAPSIHTSAGAIHIRTAVAAKVQVVSMPGAVIYSATTAEATVNVPVGIYVVITDNVSTKVIVSSK
jgi:hypothetical protein